MATYIKTLKEDNGDIVYPQTTTDAIYTTGGETLETRISKYVTAEDIAQSVASFGTVTTGMIADDAITTAKLDDDAVTTAKIDDGAVTSQKIDWTTEGATLVPANANLNSTAYMNTGVYYCPSSRDGATITNNPSKAAFKMWVINLLNNQKNNYTNDGWCYFLRIMAHGTNENMYRQHVTRKSDGTWTYGTWTSEQYQSGDSFSIGEDIYLTGRQRFENNKKYIWATMFLEKSVRPGVSVSFTPSGYNEAFNESSGVMFSQNNPTTSQLVFTCNVSGLNRNIINFRVELVASSYPLNANHPCILHLSGTLNFS